MNEVTRGQLMCSEIHEQPEVLARLLDAEQQRVWDYAQRWRETPPRGILIAARGTSDHAALYAKYVFETMNGIPVGLMAPSVSSIYHKSVNVKDYLVIGISQSGEAADVIAVLEQANQSGAATLAITNVGSSPIVSVAQETIELHAKPEISVAATKTYTATMAALLLLSAAMGNNTECLHGIKALPALIQDAFAGENTIQDLCKHFHYMRECVVLGRGYNMATAYELALKLRETCYIRSQPFASPDFVHGPIAILDEGYPVIAFANQGEILPSVMEVVEKTLSRGADLIVLGNAQEALAKADMAFPINLGKEAPEVLSPFPSIAVGQLIAYNVSVLKGYDPDNPRGLRKVTITK